MTELTIKSTAGAGVHLLDLAVSLSGDEITVSSGTILYEGVTLELDDDEVFQVSPRTNTTEVMGYVVMDPQDNTKIRVFVDEIEDDGVDFPYDFEQAGEYELLFYLFQFMQPPGPVDLGAIDYHRWIVEEE